VRRALAHADASSSDMLNRTQTTTNLPRPINQSIIGRRASTEIQLDLQVATFGKSELFPESNSSNPPLQGPRSWSWPFFTVGEKPTSSPDWVNSVGADLGVAVVPSITFSSRISEVQK
jgi:hypothetical protein